MPAPVPIKKLVPLTLAYCRSLLQTLKEATDTGSLQSWLQIDQPAHKDPTNVTRRIDDIAQRLAIQYFDRELGDAIERYGEEGKPLPPDIEKKKKTVLLIDPIDGTDLLARGFSNWCSALVFFCPSNPPGERILLAAVAHGAGIIYYAKADGAFVELPPKVKGFMEGSAHSVRTIKHRPRKRLKIADASPDLNNSTVCFYGQKAGSLMNTVSNRGFMNRLSAIHKITDSQKKLQAPVPGFRIYNLGGNPMLAKIAEGTVNAVFRQTACEPHDFVPGAFIATKAGASAINLEGTPLSIEDYLLVPTRRSGYVVATSMELAQELQKVLT
jgi:fructose-1,6-bisphosphatase/inositol monophosphatase family enzyme